MIPRRRAGGSVSEAVRMTLTEFLLARVAERFPDCEGWTCQSCGADNFIPPGFVRITSPVKSGE